MDLSRFHPLKIGLVMILLILIMLPVSAAIVGFGQTLGAHRDTNETFALSGQLVGAEEITRGFRGGELRMFPDNEKIYKIELRKGEANYRFFVALPESPERFVGQQVILEYNCIRNIFGRVVMVEGASFGSPLPSPVGNPIYGKIAIDTCANE